jgi:palmitoyltransferase ZDHHC1/11
VTVFCLAYTVVKTDPSDPVIEEEHRMRALGLEFPEDKYEYYCDRCDSHVHDTSKHCRRCNRCTYEFDHHCIWLNNCVGFNNYRPFLALIATFSATLLV